MNWGTVVEGKARANAGPSTMGEAVFDMLSLLQVDGRYADVRA